MIKPQSLCMQCWPVEILERLPHNSLPVQEKEARLSVQYCKLNSQATGKQEREIGMACRIKCQSLALSQKVKDFPCWYVILQPPFQCKHNVQNSHGEVCPSSQLCLLQYKQQRCIYLELCNESGNKTASACHVTKKRESLRR